MPDHAATTVATPTSGPARVRWRTALAALTTAITLLAVACGGDTGGDGGELGAAVEGDVDLSGVELTVGGKGFTEQLVAGQIAMQALEAAGASVTDQTSLAGTSVVRDALLAGDVDMYWEYTGTGWITILGNTEPVAGAQAQYEAVAEADAANGVVWLDPADADNTFAIAAGPRAQERADPQTVSDYAAVVAEDPSSAGLCTAAEFVTRDDGLPGLEDAYGFDLPDGEVHQLDFGLVFARVAENDPCEYAVVFATDGRIDSLDLRLLEDDEGFFPAYNLSPTMREDVYEANADAYDAIFDPITDLLDNATMRSLNARVDAEGEDPADVARDFLVENDLIEG